MNYRVIIILCLMMIYNAFAMDNYFNNFEADEDLSLSDMLPQNLHTFDEQDNDSNPYELFWHTIDLAPADNMHANAAITTHIIDNTPITNVQPQEIHPVIPNIQSTQTLPSPGNVPPLIPSLYAISKSVNIDNANTANHIDGLHRDCEKSHKECPVCSEMVRYRLLTQHGLTHVTEIKNDVNPTYFACNNCNQQILQKTSIWNHLTLCTQRKQCPNCKAYYREMRLASHIARCAQKRKM